LRSPSTPGKTPAVTYYAVIFSSQRAGSDPAYGATAARMEEIAREQPGFLGIESARSAEGFGITVSYWESEEAIAAWKANAEHLVAQHRGRAEWYERFTIRVARVEREYGGP
jgi:heme-degrading monooxygenase HmoA